MTRSFVDRDPRRALYVQVVTDPPLGDCWSLNVSASGLALSVANPTNDVRVGAELTVVLNLPDGGDPLDLSASVVWRQDSKRDALTLGVTYNDITAAERARINAYVVGHQFNVAVMHASPPQRDAIEAAISESAVLHFPESYDALADVIQKEGVAVIIMCGASLEDFASSLSEGRRAIAEHPLPMVAAHDLAPRLIYIGPASPDALLTAFNENVLYSAWPGPPPRARLRDSVLEACRDLMVRHEQHRIVLSQARALAAERAQRKRAPSQRTPVAVVAESAAMRQVLALIEKIAAHKVSVLLQGETGSGKEVLARLIHDQSDRQQKPFVVQDCGTLTETLLESELFGHVRGSFTGAVADHPGLFVIANGGTIFLDEIENTTPKVQANLLRVIETGELRAVGSRSSKQVDVRVIAASNKSLPDEVRAGRFRSDLYYRLSSFPLDVPPLRERPADIVPLAHHFLALAGVDKQLTPQVEAALMAHDWPGNVRELRNVIERALILAGADEPISVHVLPKTVRDGGARAEPGTAAFLERVEKFEQALIAEALARHDGNLSRTADALQLSRMTLARKVKRYGLKLPS